MSRVVRLHGFGGPEALSVDEVKVDHPGHGEVRLQMHAIGLNRAELTLMSGAVGTFPVPMLIGYEGVGTIDAVGEGVSGFSVGDDVGLLPGLPMGYGACGELILAPAEVLVSVPRGQSHVEAAATWMAYVTAYGLRSECSIAPGDAVLITAASSSVGLAAIQIVNAQGGVPIAVTTSRDKAVALSKCGAAQVVVREDEDLPERVREATGGRGATVAFDAVAGVGFQQILNSLAAGGTAIVYGNLGGEPAEFSASDVARRGLAIRGFGARRALEGPSQRAQVLAYVSDGMTTGELRPVISRTFRLAEIADAYRYLQSNQQIGKVVVEP